MTARAPLRARLAIAIISSVVLLVQICATRLLSATVTYHAAFAVLALVMLALAGSAVAVYRDRAARGSLEQTDLGPAARVAIIAGPVIAGTGLVYVLAGMVAWPAGFGLGVHFLVAFAGLYACFHACGYVVAWLLSAWPEDVGRVYFADLAGASAGCLLAVPLLQATSPIQLFCVFGVAAAASGWLLAEEAAVARRAVVVAGVLAVVTVVAATQPTWVRLRTAKDEDQSSVLFERWNQLTRVTVSPEVPGVRQAVEMLAATESPDAAREQALRWGAGWGISAGWQGHAPESLWIELDTSAGTQILKGGGSGPLDRFDSLKWDVTSAAYWLKPGGLRRTFVIGGGGGRDFLTSLAFGAGAVDVVELNPLVVRAVQDEFGDFSGRPYTREGVQYRIGDARSELSRSSQHYDLIQMSMIDTWAASMSGALTLSENALYTAEAFRSYFDHLAPDGIFSVSRWYTNDNYAETARVVSLIGDALRNAGVDHPEDHLAVVFNASSFHESWVANCMMKRSAFSDADKAVLRQVAAEKGFGILWPEIDGVTVHQKFDVGALVRGQDAALHSEGFDLTPPTDDRPFFFYIPHTPNAQAVSALFAFLLLVVVVVGRVLVFAPLAEIEAARPVEQRTSLASTLPETAYFAALGLSFMGVELGVLQRYIVFLGHPTYALSVVLFSLLLSTALGSLLVSSRPNVARAAFPALLIALALTVFAVPPLLESWYGWSLAARVVAAGALIVPLGICMGTAWPSGVAALAAGGRDRLVPWMWAVNGLAGTLASILGMLVAMRWGYTVLLLLATFGYAGAWVARARMARRISPAAST
ncbi:MAG TPA: hypothetical protein VGK20_06395 [Candidatus Binatia bacterium]